LKKGRPGRRRRLKGKRGRGTLAKEKPPIFGMIQRTGAVLIRMLVKVKQVTIGPLIQDTIAEASVVYTDEYDIYARLSEWGYDHRTVCHAKGEYARDDDGDGFCETQSTHSKDSGHSCGVGCARTEGSRRRSYLCTSHSSSSSITSGFVARAF
jgi:transposase-like protein